MTLDLQDLAEEAFIAHYGVKGMRWGKRNPRNSDYGDSQVKRDIQVYGKRGARRVNRQLNDGDRISVARGNEKTRRDAVMSRNKYVRQGGKVAGAVGGVIAANVGISAASTALYSKTGRNIASKILGNSDFANIAAMALNNPVVRVTASVGAAKVASMFSGDAAVAINMRANGYDPRRK